MRENIAAIAKWIAIAWCAVQTIRYGFDWWEARRTAKKRERKLKIERKGK